HLRVDPGRHRVTMSEVITDLLEAVASLEEMLGARMAKLLRAVCLLAWGDGRETLRHDLVESFQGEGPEGRLHRQEQRAGTAPRPTAADVKSDGVPDRRLQRKGVDLDDLRSGHTDPIPLPVNVIEGESANLAGT